MTTVLDVLRDRGYRNVDESALVRAVQDALPARTEAADPITPDAGQVFLAAHSGVRITDEAVTGAAHRLAARRIAETAQALDTAAAADLLGVHRTRVQHLRDDGDLYAYRDGRRNRYPLWQFTDQRRPLPGLRRILAALGPVHRSVVAGFMTTVQPDLDTRTGPVNARDWLAAGRDPEPVVELARAVTQPW
ncbi:MAG TPA: helix-turn-helix domain-containing protein [Nakamurella sp.]